MNKHFKDKLAASAVLATLLAVVCSCRPAVREVVKVVSQIPIAVSRDQVRQVLLGVRILPKRRRRGKALMH